MKKVCFFAAGFLSITLAETAVSGDFVGSDNVIGVMAVQSDKKATIVAIPFKDCDGGDMRLSVFVKTANLAAGDQLYRYDSAKGGFDGWILSVGADGILFWEKCEKNFRLTKSGEFTSDDGKDADEERVAQGPLSIPCREAHLPPQRRQLKRARPCFSAIPRTRMPLRRSRGCRTATRSSSRRTAASSTSAPTIRRRASGAIGILITNPNGSPLRLSRLALAFGMWPRVMT